MEPFIIDPTEFTPKVMFDPARGIFMIAGESRPESSELFYQPVTKWLEEYAEELIKKGQTKAITLQFHIDYLNTSTSLSLVYLLHRLELAAQKGLKIDIKWFYMEMDESMKEQGDEFALMNKGLAFEMICL